MLLKESCNRDFKNSWKLARKLVTASTKDELYWGIINIVNNMKKTREIEKYLQHRKKIRVLKYAQDFSARDACETFGVTKTTFYNWKNKFDKYGEKGLERKIRDPKTYGNRLDSKVIELILVQVGRRS